MAPQALVAAPDPQALVAVVPTMATGYLPLLLGSNRTAAGSRRSPTADALGMATMASWQKSLVLMLVACAMTTTTTTPHHPGDAPGHQDGGYTKAVQKLTGLT